MAEQKPVLGVEITGLGASLPVNTLTNDEFIERYGLDSSDDWIKERSGIERRHIISGEENVVSLAVEASHRALKASGIEPPYEVDKLFLGTTTPYRDVNGAHPSIQHGLRQLGYNVLHTKESDTACTGFMTVLLEAYRNFSVDGIDSALAVGADTLSKITDLSDRGTAILFADGAGAAALQTTERQSGLLGWYEATDSDYEGILYAEPGGYIQMQGREVFKQAVPAMIRAAQIAMERANVEMDEIALVVPHQANLRIIELAAKKMGVGMDRVVTTVKEHGNTSSASIPLALEDAVRLGRIARGEKWLGVGFGGGMTEAAGVMIW